MGKFLTEEQIKELKEVHRLCVIRQQADRVKAILMLNEGLSYHEVATLLLLDETTVRRYEKTYRKKGLPTLVLNNYKGGQAQLTILQQTEVKEYFREHTPRTAQEIVAYIQKTYKKEYSVIGVTKLMHRLGFVYKKPKLVPGKVDKGAQEQFITLYEQTKKQLGNHDRIYFLDASHPTHNTTLSYGWILKGKAHDKWVKSTSGRKRLNLHGAINLTDKKAIVLEEQTIDAKATIHLLNEIKRKQRRGKVYIVLDNAKHHHARTVWNWLLRRPRFKLLYLPAYSPNLNIIERLWRFYHQQITYNQYFESFKEFKQTTLAFFKNLKPYEPQLATLLTDSFQTLPE